MNRIFLGRPCACCEARRYVEKCRAVAEDLEAKGDGLIEFVVPTLGAVADDGRRGISLCFIHETERIVDLDGAADLVAAELRELADRLLAVADRIGGAA